MELQRKQTATMSDEKIVDLYWQRDEQAIKETDIKYKRFLLSLANNIVHDMCDSEECLNDTYIGAWNSIPPARPVLLQSFLATIIRRTAINRFNANKRQKRIVSEYTVSLSELEDFIADEGDMDAEMETKETKNWTRKKALTSGKVDTPENVSRLKLGEVLKTRCFAWCKCKMARKFL